MRTARSTLGVFALLATLTHCGGTGPGGERDGAAETAVAGDGALEAAVSDAAEAPLDALDDEPASQEDSAVSEDAPAPLDAPAAEDVFVAPDAPAPDAPRDAPADVRPHRPTLPTCESTEPDGPIVLPPVASTLVNTVAPVGSRVSVANPLSNPSSEEGEEAYRRRNFHQYRQGPAQARVRRTDLGGPASAPAAAQRRSLAYFVQISDYQLTDDESPARFASTDTPYLSSGLRPHEAYLPRAASAMNRTLARIQRPERPFAFGVFAGDCADTGQLNELRWFMQLMNGERLHTDSGDDDDPVLGPDNDPKDPFTPVAFPAPWYYVPGNHDLMQVGVWLSTEERSRQAMGSDAAAGTRDYTRWWAPVRTGTVVADANRRLVSRADIVRELQGGPAMPGPVGHGFPAGMAVNLGANYVADVVPGLLRMLALDTSDDTGGSQGMVRRATVDRWLRPELERAQRDGVLVILVSHHPLDSINRLMGEIGPLPVLDAVSSDDLENVVQTYPNVLAWMVGHQHEMRVRPIRGRSGRAGFWEVQSGSIADWPGQARVLELVDNGDNTLSLFGTMVDFDANDCMERRFRRLQVMDYLSRWASDHTGAAADRNVELVFPLPATAMAAVQRARATAPERLESETTLRGMR